MIIGENDEESKEGDSDKKDVGSSDFLASIEIVIIERVCFSFNFMEFLFFW